MLTADEIQSLNDVVGIITNSVNAYLIRDVCERIAAAGQITRSAEYSIFRSETLGVHFATIKREIEKRLNLSAQELDDLFGEAAKRSYNNEVKIFDSYIPFEDNGSIQQIVKASQALAQEDFSNITQTLGMVDRHGRELPLKRFYNNVMDDVFNRVSTGATDYNTAIRDASTALADRGVTSIGYQSGVITSLEAAVRRNVLSGLGLMVEQISQDNFDKLQADGWEVSAHMNCAEDHEPIQGRRFTNEEWLEINGTAEKPGKLKRRIGTLNCGHTASPALLAVQEPQYSEETLQEYKDANAKGIEYQGRHYTGYQATQEMRRIERVIRKWKKRNIAAEATGDDEMILRTKAKLTNARRVYKEFADAAGLRTQQDRLFVVGGGTGRRQSMAG